MQFDLTCNREQSNDELQFDINVNGFFETQTVPYRCIDSQLMMSIEEPTRGVVDAIGNAFTSAASAIASSIGFKFVSQSNVKGFQGRADGLVAVATIHNHGAGRTWAWIRTNATEVYPGHSLVEIPQDTSKSVNLISHVDTPPADGTYAIMVEAGLQRQQQALARKVFILDMKRV